MFFQLFERGGQQLLSRAWLIDPSETQANVAVTTASKGDKEPWNGEFYVSFGDEHSRSRDDAVRYGYISGGGSWYSKTLSRRCDLLLKCARLKTCTQSSQIDGDAVATMLARACCPASTISSRATAGPGGAGQHRRGGLASFRVEQQIQLPPVEQMRRCGHDVYGAHLLAAWIDRSGGAPAASKRPG